MLVYQRVNQTKNDMTIAPPSCKPKNPLPQNRLFGDQMIPKLRDWNEVPPRRGVTQAAADNGLGMAIICYHKNRG